MKNQIKMKIQICLLIAFYAITFSSPAQIGAWNPKLEEKSAKTISIFEKKNDNMKSYFDESYGYVVFPSIGKGGIVVGGAHGRGIVYQQGEMIGQAKMTQVTVGLQWGGQAFSEVIFFKDPEALESFKNGNLEFAGQVSAVAVTKGASADIAYENGVAVYTLSKAGLMYEASLGGQKFKYLPNDEQEEEDSEIVKAE